MRRFTFLIATAAAVLAAIAWTGARRTAAKGLAFCLAIIAWTASPVRAQWAVADAGNLVQNTTTALNSVRSVAQQVSAYQLQLQQYANQMKQATGLADVARVYQQYQQTMQELQSLYGQFANGGSLQNYLNQFQSVQYWAQVPPGNYPAAAQQNWAQNSQTQKQKNDDWAQALAQHQQLLQGDAARLQAAQQSAAGADGELAAIQASAQINAAIANQLLQIHALLVQEQEALQARQATVANDEAMRKAASDAWSNAAYQPSSQKSFKP